MVYQVSQKISTFGLLEYPSTNMLTRDDFWQGIRLGSFEGTLKYRVKRKADTKKLGSLHMIESASGPLLVSAAFRAVVESVAPSDAEFIRAEIDCGATSLTSFYAMNLLDRISCIDMEKSEFEQINFDPSDPRYSFSYAVMNSDWDSPVVIASCAEQRNRIVVRDVFKAACFAKRLQGLIFYEALDMTPSDRSVGTSIS